MTAAIRTVNLTDVITSATYYWALPVLVGLLVERGMSEKAASSVLSKSWTDGITAQNWLDRAAT
jgi:hypothetical protein